MYEYNINDCKKILDARNDIKAYLSKFSNTYKDINEWSDKIIKEYSNNCGREIIISQTKEGKINGLLVIKNTKYECKLCHLSGEDGYILQKLFLSALDFFRCISKRKEFKFHISSRYFNYYNKLINSIDSKLLKVIHTNKTELYFRGIGI